MASITPTNTRQHPKMKAYTDELLSALASFERVSEWPDLIKALGKVNKVLTRFSYIDSVPCLLLLSKRLAQCTSPGLPGGVHLKCLETYTVVFRRLGRLLLLRNLGLFSAGLFPLLAASSTRVRPQLLQLFEEHYLPLGRDLVPALPGLLPALLPGLEDNTSDSFPRVLRLLRSLRQETDPGAFLCALWRCTLSCPGTRRASTNFIADVLQGEEFTALLPGNHALVHEALVQTLLDADVLAQRSVLEVLLGHVSVDEELGRAVFSRSICVLLRREASVNRRFFTWLLRSERFVTLLQESLLEQQADVFPLVSLLMERAEVEQSQLLEGLFGYLLDLAGDSGTSLKEAQAFFRIREPERVWTCLLAQTSVEVLEENRMNRIRLGMELLPASPVHRQQLVDSLFAFLMASENTSALVEFLLQLTDQSLYPTSTPCISPIPPSIPHQTLTLYTRLLLNTPKPTKDLPLLLQHLVTHSDTIFASTLWAKLVLRHPPYSPKHLTLLLNKAWDLLDSPTHHSQTITLLETLLHLNPQSLADTCSDHLLSHTCLALHRFASLWRALPQRRYVLQQPLMLVLDALDGAEAGEGILMAARNMFQHPSGCLEDVLAVLLEMLGGKEEEVSVYAWGRLRALLGVDLFTNGSKLEDHLELALRTSEEQVSFSVKLAALEFIRALAPILFESQTKVAVRILSLLAATLSPSPNHNSSENHLLQQQLLTVLSVLPLQTLSPLFTPTLLQGIQLAHTSSSPQLLAAWTRFLHLSLPHLHHDTLFSTTSLLCQQLHQPPTHTHTLLLAALSATLLRSASSASKPVQDAPSFLSGLLGTSSSSTTATQSPSHHTQLLPLVLDALLAAYCTQSSQKDVLALLVPLFLRSPSPLAAAFAELWTRNEDNQETQERLLEMAARLPNAPLSISLELLRQPDTSTQHIQGVAGLVQGLLLTHPDTLVMEQLLPDLLVLTQTCISKHYPSPHPLLALLDLLVHFLARFPPSTQTQSKPLRSLQDTLQNLTHALVLVEKDFAQTLSALTHTLPTLLPVFHDKERKVAALSQTLPHLMPLLHSSVHTQNAQDVALLLSSLSLDKDATRAWKKDLWNQFHAHNFFRKDLLTLGRLRDPLGRLLEEKQYLEELLALSSQSRILTSHQTHVHARCKALKRLSFALLSGRLDQFSRHMSALFETLADALKVQEAAALQAQVLLCMRVMLWRFSPDVLKAVWPVVLTEVIRAFEGGERDVLLQACKFVDLALVTMPRQFQLYQWMFVEDRFARTESPDLPTGNALNSFVPHLLSLSRRIAEMDGDFIPEAQNEILGTNGHSRPLLSMTRLDDVRQLRGFHEDLCERIAQSAHLSLQVDTEFIEEWMLADFIEAE